MTVVTELAAGGVFDTAPQLPSGPDQSATLFPPALIPELIVPKDVYQGLPNAPMILIPDRLNEVGITGLAGNEKGVFMEERVRDIVSVHPKVREVILHTKEDPQDGKGHDITVYFTEESGIAPINIQVKSSQDGIARYRKKIAHRLKEAGSKMTVNEWLILDRTIALNGALTSEQEILYNFVMGIANIVKRYEAVSKEHKYIELFEPPITV
jgi:hypothetical protein